VSSFSNRRDFQRTNGLADEYRFGAVQSRPMIDTAEDSEELVTLEALERQREEKRKVKALLEKQRLEEEEKEKRRAEQTGKSEGEGEGGQEGGMGGLEEEAGQQGAFNPETGEINWDCPCLGGMAHGPCGEEFKAAFSCFVYSTEEPKGMDCIEKFKYGKLLLL